MHWRRLLLFQGILLSSVVTFLSSVYGARWKLLIPGDEEKPFHLADHPVSTDARKYSRLASTFSSSSFHVFGGESEGYYSNSIKSFDIFRKKWTTLPAGGDVPAPRAGATLTKIGSALYLIGGHNENGTIGSIHQYGTMPILLALYAYSDVITNKWYHVYVPDDVKFMSRSGHVSCTDGLDRIFIFGGYNDEGIFLNDLYEITIVSNSIPESNSKDISASFKLLSADPSSKGLNPSPKEFASLQLVDGILYLYGGYTYGGSSKDGMWLYNLKESKWSLVDCPLSPPPCEGLSSLTLGRSILYFGGCDFGYGSNRCYNDLWRFDTTTSKWYIIPTSDSLPRGRAFAAMAILNDTLIVHGGSKLDKRAFGDTYQLLDLLPCKDPDHRCLGRGKAQCLRLPPAGSGVCSGVTCLCNEGYTGHDCSITLVSAKDGKATELPKRTEM
ncbi:Kelch domain-containing protein 3 [Babesia sp. Xinjiang]|uniref:Kelch domain-containing protein 3 n=1 Tax=Babesia sp. Xinjiang TaxID=462227 RepID=UPI000A25E9BE|nr:Kelch domain-containing protein 3 [Babesia sp. Xinjiang]ORM42059.1 Kelch domain-containing protein 3 [Babesia sp. Xinjiang]